ncbi:hypothetical protein INT45_000848 [Circinella minor]|uniref:Uncharacterized protein n=1 Tax=Circinella minor TaxID=1195481 RepID=A0A8H7S8Q1_9FUNG|nr:hypothetical protein INT45_000848 [Circinella minor]
MGLNLKTSKQSATIVPMALLADLSLMEIRARTLQLKFTSKLQTFLTTTMSRSITQQHQAINILPGGKIQNHQVYAKYMYYRSELIFTYQFFRRIDIDLSSGVFTGFLPILLRIVDVVKKKRNGHFSTCPLLTTLLLFLANKSEIGLSSKKWKAVWPAFIRVLRKTDFLSQPNEIFDEDEPAPEEALELSIAITEQNEK